MGNNEENRISGSLKTEKPKYSNR